MAKLAPICHLHLLNWPLSFIFKLNITYLQIYFYCYVSLSRFQIKDFRLNSGLFLTITIKYKLVSSLDTKGDRERERERKSCPLILLKWVIVPAEFIVVINPRIRLNFNFYFDANFFFSSQTCQLVKFKRKIIIIITRNVFYHHIFSVLLSWLAAWLVVCIQ